MTLAEAERKQGGSFTQEEVLVIRGMIERFWPIAEPAFAAR